MTRGPDHIGAWLSYVDDLDDQAWSEFVWRSVTLYFGLPVDATAAQVDYRVYKDTACGASFMVTEGGDLLFSTIVEGSDAEDAATLAVDDLRELEPEDADRRIRDRIESILQRLEDFAEEHYEEWA